MKKSTFEVAARFDEMSADRIKEYPGCAGIPLEIKKYGTVESTNIVAKRLAEDGAPEWTIVTADSQTNGYGRLGRQYFSPGGSGIYISVILRPDTVTEKLSDITTAAAVAVCEAIESVSDLKPSIKWVNDVYLDGKKVCGILTETKFSGETAEYSVLGIGINLYKPANGFDTSIRGKAGYLFEHAESERKIRIIAAVIASFYGYYTRLDSTAHLDGYRKRMFLCGKTVGVTANGETKQAEVLGLTDDFGLEVRYMNGKKDVLCVGEVSLTV